MAQATIGAIRVNLGMDSAEFEKDVKNMSRKMDQFGRRLAGIGAAVAASFAAIGSAAALAFTKVADHADSMAKAAQQIGIPVEDLTALAHAADLSGVSFEKLKTGIGQFSRNISDTIDGASSEGVKALAKLNISFKDLQGNSKSTAHLLEDVADRFQAMPDGAQKTALAMQLFGKAGRDMIPLLNSGSAGLAKMQAEAAKLGLVLSTQTGQQAERFNDNLTRMKSVLQGVAQSIFANVIPSMVMISERLVQAATEGGLFDGVIKGLTNAFNFMVNTIVLVVKNLGVLYNLFKVFVAAKVVSFTLHLARSMIILAKGIRTAGLALAVFTTIKRASMATFAILVGLIAHATGNLDNLADAITHVADRVAALLPEGSMSGLTSMFEPINAEDIGLTTSLLDGAADAAASFAPAVTSAATAADKLSKSLGKETGVAGKGESARKALKSVSETAKKAADEISPVGRKLQDTFGSWIDSAIEGTFNLKSALKDLAKDMAKLAFKNALGGLFGGGGFGGLSALFGGAPAFASGGSMKVGGTGGIDSQMRLIRASPNETITVTKPSQSIAGGGGYAPVYNIDARGADAAAVARIEGSLRQRDKEFGKRVVATNHTTRLRGVRA